MDESTTTRVADLTLAEFEAVIERVISRILDQKHMIRSRWLNENVANDTRTLDEVFASIDRHMWTPPPGVPSSMELLREDRDADGELYR